MPQAFPELDAGNTVNEDVYAPSLRRDVPVGLGELSSHLDGVGNELQQMAVRAASNEGEAQGSADAAAGVVAPRDPNTAFGQKYNDVAKAGLGEQRRASIIQDVGTALASNPDNPAELQKSLGAIKAGYGATPYADLNAQLDNEFALHSADAIARAQDGLQKSMVSLQASNLDTAYNTGISTLTQVASGLPFDAGGAQRKADGLTNFLTGLVPYGPREAFDIGPLHVPADPSRAGKILPEKLNALGISAAAEITRAWVLSAQKTLPTSASQAKFADDARTRYEAGDKIFAGLDGPHAESLFNALDTQAQKQGQDERIDQAQHTQNTEQLLEAFQWGSKVDPAQLRSEAQASGNTALMARANFYLEAGDQVRGVLKTVVARQLGLIPTPGAARIAPVMLDAQGAPVASDMTTNPAGFFGRILGGDVQITSGARTPAHNAAVGGSPASEHIPGNGVAYDLKPPAGMSNQEAVQRLTQAGVPFDQIIDEGTHVHFGVGPAMRGQVLRGSNGSYQVVSAGGAATPVAAVATGAGAWTPPPGTAPGSPAYAAWVNTRPAFAADPVKYAAENNLASVAPMIPQAAWSQDPAALANWSAAIKARAATGAALQASYGVPGRMLTDAEKDDYKSYLAANPQAGVSLGARAMAALGGAGATQLLNEIGVGGEVQTPLHIGWLAANGAPAFAQLAASGLQLKAQGAKEIPNPAYAATQATEIRNLGPAFRFDPQAMATGRNVADLARLTDNQSGQDHDAAYYLQTALGRNRGPDGSLYGGVAPVNGAPTLLPTWLRQDSARDALAALGKSWAATPGRGPVSTNGMPLRPADVGNMQLMRLPTGTYLMRNPQSGLYARHQDGSLVNLDLEGERAWLSQRLPGAVRR